MNQSDAKLLNFSVPSYSGVPFGGNSSGPSGKPHHKEHIILNTMFRNLSLLPAVAALTVAVSCSQPAPEISIIPVPQSISVKSGVFKVPGATVSFDAAATDDMGKGHIMDFASKLTTVTGKPSPVQESLSEKGFSFAVDPTLGSEEYAINISSKAVKVRASTGVGFFYAIQTISQMLPEAYFAGKSAPSEKWVLPKADIQDKPRFAYRGMHMDPCRHFFDVDEVKKYLDVMAMHKLNRLHWHLTEDQGWRIEIKKYPRLTEVGAFRDQTIVDKNFDPFIGDGRRYGGFYTQEQIKDVVTYAANLGITIVPEVDLPGHMIAALASYPYLGCTGKQFKVWERWGVADEVLCPGKESTFEFLEGVLGEIMELFPSEYIHIGGDECPKTYWKTCPHCQKRIKELGLKSDDKHSAEDYLQNYVTARVQKFVNDHGRKIIGWDEILEGNLAEGATVMSWRGVAGGIEAAKNGFDAIMTPNSHMYFDYYQSKEIEKEPLAIGGYLPIDTVYSYDPYKGIPEEARHHILGVQANLWTEYIEGNTHLEYMLLPRLDALSEVQWCEPGNKDFDRFKKSLERMCRVYDILGYTYSKQVFGEPGLPGHEGRVD